MALIVSCVNLTIVVAFLATLARSQTAPILTPSVPLAVRSPYFSAWIAANNGSSPAGVWPNFWTVDTTLGWSGLIRVDGQHYQWMGQGSNSTATTLASYITPTRSIFTLSAGNIEFNATFLSPIEPGDLTRQSLPFSYLYIDAKSTDGNTHSIQLYFDTTAEWITPNTDDTTVQWSTTQTDQIIYQQMESVSVASMSVVSNMAVDGILYFSMKKRDGLAWQTGSFDTLRSAFRAGSTLNNTDDTNYRAISDDWPVVAMTVDLGTISQTSAPVVLALGYVRDPVIRYVKDSAVELRSPYFKTKYTSASDAVTAFILDFDSALTRANALDQKILLAGNAVSTEYSDLLSVSFRQTMAGLDITVSKTSNSTPTYNASDVKVFMKDIGTSARVNPVDTLYAALPALLYFDPSIVGPTLLPLFEYQSSSAYTNGYAAPDLGTSYPDVKGNSTDTTLLAVESCSSMLIMSLAHVLKSGDTSIITTYYGLLRAWADYLVKTSLHPSGYTTMDGQTNADMSNLALKGILGIYSMAKINSILEPAGKLVNDTQYYSTTASDYANQWESLAVPSGSDHVATTYGSTSTSSWSLIYNLYAAQLLGTELISQKIYSEQTSFYASQVPSAPRFGFAYDTNDNNKAKSHWTLFAAAATTDNSTRNALISMVHERAFFNRSIIPFPTIYIPTTGESFGSINGRASPLQGAMFAPLALTLPFVEISVQASGEKKKTSNIKAIVGGVVSGVVAFVLIVLALFLWRRRRTHTAVWDYSNPSNPVQTISTHGRGMRRGGNKQPILPGKTASFITPFTGAIIAEPERSNDGYTFPPSHPPFSKAGEAGILLEPEHARAAPTAYTATTSAAGSGGSSDSSNLRSEVEELRREMAQIKAQRLQSSDEPPPMYH